MTTKKLSKAKVDTLVERLYHEDIDRRNQRQLESAVAKKLKVKAVRGLPFWCCAKAATS